MKCHDLLDWLNDYVGGGIDPAICKEFEQHLAGCNLCRVVVDTVRKTITLYREAQPYELPPEFRERLRVPLRRKWKATHSRS